MKVVIDVPAECMNSQRTAALVAQSLARSVMQINRVFFRKHPEIPKLYDLYNNRKLRVVYEREPWAGSGVEEFAPAHVVLARGWGDCDDLAPYRAAEIWEREKRPADILVYWRKRSAVWHLEVRHWPSHKARKAGHPGEVEDPSRLLGMTLE